MEVIFSEEFIDQYRKIKNHSIQLKILKQVNKLEILPESGKPLKHDFKGKRSLRIHPFRLIYTIEQDKIIINCFDHRKDVYN